MPMLAVLFVLLLSALPALAQTPPVIITQPQSSTNVTATEIIFTVEATGTAPLHYQWYFSHNSNTTIRLTEETNPSLIYTNLGAFQQGIYTVVITNVAGAVTSAPAFLTVLVPPAITRQPTNQIVPVGGTAIFTTAAVGDQPITYQWFYNVIVEIVGATNTTLILTNVQPSDSGTYQAEASNIADTVNTVEAVLLVKYPPVFTSQPTNLALPPGGAAAFSVAVAGDGPFRYQWFFNDTNAIFAATNDSYSIPSVQLQNSGTYTVRVTSDVGIIASAPATLVVLQAPVITQQPASLTAFAGGAAAFSVGANGTVPMHYQWFFNGTNALPEGTNATLSIANLQAQDSGVYSVQISNQVGAVTSANATLVVVVPPFITQQPAPVAVPLGQQAVFTVQAAGSAPLIYRWYFNGTNPIVGATSSALVFSSAQFGNAGSYTVTITNLAGAVTSSPAALVIQSPPVIAQQPANRAAVLGGSATFSVVAQGETPLTYQWFFNTNNSILDATNSTLLLTNVESTSVGRYSVRISNRLGTVFSSQATLSIKQPPTITQQPSSLTVTQGSVAAFTVAVSGDGPFGYRWLFNGTNALPANNGPTLVRANASAANAGVYSVIVTNDVGSATSADATLTVRLIPAIIQQPASLILPPGAIATFGVSVIGEAPFSYQWRYYRTNNLPDATNSTLSLTNIQLDQIGSYSVVVSNSVGFTASDDAMLSIQLPPSISQQPASLIVTQGQSGSFAVLVQGDGPFSYRWFFNVTSAVPNATAATLVLSNVQPAAAGEYSVRVTNMVGSVLSSPATLTVRDLPRIAQQPVSLIVTQGQNATFSIVADSSTPLTYRWRRNGLDLAATTPSLILNNVQVTGAGQYDVVVGNDYGAVTSAVATLTVFGIDFGDAPHPLYPTLLSDDAARHVLVPGVHLGSAVDPEPDGQPDPTATGDNASGVNDEEGVRFLTALRVGQSATLEVVVSTSGLLNAWMDFNQANSWLDDGEQILTNHTLIPGTNLVSFIIPPSATSGNIFARFRFSTASDLSFTGLAPDGEVEDYRTSLESAADLELTQLASVAVTPAGSDATFTLYATNLGPSAASNVIVTARLSSRSTFGSASTGQGSCAFANGVLTCEVGTLPSGAGLSLSFNALIGQGTNTTTASVNTSVFDPNPANNTAPASVIGTGVTPQFANSDILILPVPDAGEADPYPANAFVSGITGAVHKVLVTLRNVNHGFPDDIDVLLVGPGGRHALLMSDCGFDAPMVDVTLTFDEDALDELPDGASFIASGTYRPTEHPPVTDSFPVPAPAGPYAANLGVFRGTDPNGVWSLYVVDDSVDNGASGDPGFIADGWTVTFITDEPLADLGIEVIAQPGVVSVGEPSVTSITVTNHGPSAATAIVQSVLPAGLNFVSATFAPASQGSCAQVDGTVTCTLGALAAGGSVSFAMETVATIGGSFTNTLTVAGSQLDLNLANNSSSAFTSVRSAANLGVTLSGPPSVLLLQPFHSVVSITNAGPNTATGVWLTNRLPAGASFLSVNASQGSCTSSEGIVICSVGNLAAGAVASLQFHTTAGFLGVNSNFVRAVAAEEDQVPADNSAAHLVGVEPAVDLVLTGTTSPAAPAAGGQFNLLLTVSNAGPSAVDAVLVDRLPATLEFVSLSSTHGSCTNANGEVQCAFSQLLPGESAVVVVSNRTTVAGAMTNVAVVTGSIADYNPENNVVTNLVTVIPAADLVLSFTSRPEPVWVSDNLTYAITVTNLGPNAATVVRVTNVLPVGVNFISASSSQGACSRVGSEVRCDLGTLASGAGSSVLVVTRPTQIGLITSSAVASSAVFDPVAVNNQASRTARVIGGTGAYANSVAITTPILGLSTPFPSSINVSGVPGTIFGLRVSLANFSHTYPDDLDVLLVGPGGRTVLLMSDCGGDQAMSGVSLVFDDAAPNALPDLSAISSGLVRPTNHGTEVDVFSAPAPLGPYGTNLAVFKDSDPNGVWSLYITDDADKDFGVLASGWSLSIATISPPVISAIANVSVDEDAATGVIPFTVQDFDTPAETIVLTRISSNLALVPLANIVLGGSGTNRSMNITPAPNQSGSSLISIIATDLTGASATNQFFITVRPVLDPILILTQPQNLLVRTGATAGFSVSATSTLLLTYQWQRNGVNLAGATAPSLMLSNVKADDAGTYRVLVSNADTNLFSASATLQVTDEFPSPNIISITRSGQTAAVAFTTVVGLNYTLEYKDTFDDAGWTSVGSLPGTGNTEVITDSAATVPTRFYRVRGG